MQQELQENSIMKKWLFQLDMLTGMLDFKKMFIVPKRFFKVFNFATRPCRW